MTIEIQFDASTAISLKADRVATSATVKVVKPDGTTLSSPAVTLPSVATTTTAGTTANVLEVAAVTGISPGDDLLVTSDGVAYACTAAIVDATALTVALVTGLPIIPDVGSTVAKVALTATVTAPGGGAVGSNYRLVWTYSDGTTSTTESQAAGVVRQTWVSPIGADDVRDVLAEMQTSRSEQWCSDVAEKVDQAIRGKVEATGRRPWAYLSPMAFYAAARLGIRYELAQRGIAHGGQIYEAQRELRFAFDDALASVITSLAYDKNEDGAIDANEAKPIGYTIQAVR